MANSISLQVLSAWDHAPHKSLGQLRKKQLAFYSQKGIQPQEVWFHGWDHASYVRLPVVDFEYHINFSVAWESRTPSGGVMTFTEPKPKSPCGMALGFKGMSKVVETDKGCHSTPIGLRFFGKPVFIQNPVFPVWNDRLALPLCTWFNEWGDGGVMNFWVALGDDGKPEQVFYEASCR